VGATLAKTVLRAADGSLDYRISPAHALDELARRLGDDAPGTIGLTGGGAEALLERLEGQGMRVNEFAAWGAGASMMLREQAVAPSERHLVVSVGTGTSVLLADGRSTSRLGGTALGGGTVVGLGSALLGSRSFEEIADLAVRGDRRRVDLLVSDIYRPGEIPLASNLTAANFGRLGRKEREEAPAREDLAHAIMGLVGENVALVCAGISAAALAPRIVFGGSTLRANPALRAILEQITAAAGREPVFLREGEFAGALGSLLLAVGPDPG
jgi:type II pantothenate kinase